MFRMPRKLPQYFRNYILQFEGVLDHILVKENELSHLYSTRPATRENVDKLLEVYEGSKELIRRKFGAEGLIEYERMLEQKTQRVRQVARPM